MLKSSAGSVLYHLTSLRSVGFEYEERKNSFDSNFHFLSIEDYCGTSRYGSGQQIEVGK